jgi:DNA-binding response OmpR family regulator
LVTVVINSNRAFIVDDEPDLPILFKLGLEESGFDVDTFNDPPIALSAFNNKHSYELALTDIRMPEINGFESYKEMKKIDDQFEIWFYCSF